MIDHEFVAELRRREEERHPTGERCTCGMGKSGWPNPQMHSIWCGWRKRYAPYVAPRPGGLRRILAAMTTKRIRETPGGSLYGDFGGTSNGTRRHLYRAVVVFLHRYGREVIQWSRLRRSTTRRHEA